MPTNGACSCWGGPVGTQLCKGRDVAQEAQIVLGDDLDGGEATQTLTFGFSGVTYKIDLDDKNAAKLEKALLAPFIEAGREVGKSSSGRRRKTSGGPTAAKVREWGARQRARRTCTWANSRRRARRLRRRALIVEVGLLGGSTGGNPPCARRGSESMERRCLRRA